MILPKSLLDNVIEYNHKYREHPQHCDEITIKYYSKYLGIEKTQIYKGLRNKNKIDKNVVSVLEELQDVILGRDKNKQIIAFKIGM